MKPKNFPLRKNKGIAKAQNKKLTELETETLRSIRSKKDRSNNKGRRGV